MTNPPFGLGPIGFFPYDGSAITMWDSGPIRQENGQTVAPTCRRPRTRRRPTARTRTSSRGHAAGRAMKPAFLSVGGRVIDTCGGAPCHSTDGLRPLRPERDAPGQALSRCQMVRPAVQTSPDGLVALALIRSLPAPLVRRRSTLNEPLGACVVASW